MECERSLRHISGASFCSLRGFMWCAEAEDESGRRGFREKVPAGVELASRGTVLIHKDDGELSGTDLHALDYLRLVLFPEIVLNDPTERRLINQHAVFRASGGPSCAWLRDVWDFELVVDGKESSGRLGGPLGKVQKDTRLFLRVEAIGEPEKALCDLSKLLY